jgi:hypothetical protein
MPEHMNTDVLTAIGDIFTGLGVVVAGVSVIVGAYFGRQAAVAGREAAEQGRLSVELGQQAIEQGRQAVAEARSARREEYLYRELDRLERLAGLLKRMWAIVNRAAMWRMPPESSDLARAKQDAGLEMDALLYDLRAVLMLVGRDELPGCTHLAEGFDGPRLAGNGQSIQDAEAEVVAAITRCRAALKELA